MVVHIIQRLLVFPPAGSIPFVWKIRPITNPTIYERETKIGIKLVLTKNDIAITIKQNKNKSSGHYFIPWIGNKTYLHNINSKHTTQKEAKCKIIFFFAIL